MTYYALNKTTFQPIAETTLTGTQATITFSSLGSYDHLYVVCNMRTNYSGSTDNIYIRFNSDTGSNYNYKWWLAYGGGNSTTYGHSGAQNRIEIGTAAGATTVPSNTYSSNSLLIPNYRSTTFYKNCMTIQYGSGEKNANDIRTGIYAGTWANTAAITSLTFGSAFSASFVSGTKIAIWGI